MAKTAKGQKFNRIESYTRVVKGVKQVVETHDRSNPNHGKK